MIIVELLVRMKFGFDKMLPITFKSERIIKKNFLRVQLITKGQEGQFWTKLLLWFNNSVRV